VANGTDKPNRYTVHPESSHMMTILALVDANMARHERAWNRIALVLGLVSLIGAAVAAAGIPEQQIRALLPF